VLRRGGKLIGSIYPRADVRNVRISFLYIGMLR